MIEFLSNNYVAIMAIVGSVVTTASLIVKLTPTPKDDEVLTKVMAVINVLALNPKK